MTGERGASASAAEVWHALQRTVATSTVEPLIELILAEIPQVSRLRAEYVAAQEQILALIQDLVKAQMALAEADERIADLRAELEVARFVASRDPSELLFRTVGLAADAPPFLIKAARRAFQRELHPDVKPAAQKRACERKLQEAEAAFHEIFRLRGL